MNLLVKKAKRGDTEAFIALVEECRMTLKRVAIGYLGNEEDAADAIQDTILTAYEHIGKLKKDEYFKTWMVRILINHCTKIYRIHKKNAAWEREYEAESCDSGTADVEFRELLLALPEDSRMIFQLYYGEQFTTQEIADILHVKENTVKSRLHRGKEKLREQLK